MEANKLEELVQKIIEVVGEESQDKDGILQEIVSASLNGQTQSVDLTGLITNLKTQTTVDGVKQVVTRFIPSETLEDKDPADRQLASAEVAGPAEPVTKPNVSQATTQTNAVTPTATPTPTPEMNVVTKENESEKDNSSTTVVEESKQPELAKPELEKVENKVEEKTAIQADSTSTQLHAATETTATSQPVSTPDKNTATKDAPVEKAELTPIVEDINKASTELSTEKTEIVADKAETTLDSTLESTIEPIKVAVDTEESTLAKVATNTAEVKPAVTETATKQAEESKETIETKESKEEITDVLAATQTVMKPAAELAKASEVKPQVSTDATNTAEVKPAVTETATKQAEESKETKEPKESKEEITDVLAVTQTVMKPTAELSKAMEVKPQASTEAIAISKERLAAAKLKAAEFRKIAEHRQKVETKLRDLISICPMLELDETAVNKEFYYELLRQGAEAWLANKELEFVSKKEVTVKQQELINQVMTAVKERLASVSNTKPHK